MYPLQQLRFGPTGRAFEVSTSMIQIYIYTLCFVYIVVLWLSVVVTEITYDHASVSVTESQKQEIAHAKQCTGHTNTVELAVTSTQSEAP